MALIPSWRLHSGGPQTNEWCHRFNAAKNDSVLFRVFRQVELRVQRVRRCSERVAADCGSLMNTVRKTLRFHRWGKMMCLLSLKSRRNLLVFPSSVYLQKIFIIPPILFCPPSFWWCSPLSVLTHTRSHWVSYFKSFQIKTGGEVQVAATFLPDSQRRWVISTDWGHVTSWNCQINMKTSFCSLTLNKCEIWTFGCTFSKLQLLLWQRLKLLCPASDWLVLFPPLVRFWH